MNFSLRTLLIIMAGAAVVAASLAYLAPVVGDLFYTIGLLTIGFATLAAIYLRGSRRAYWIGFVLLFAGYFCHSVWPSELRSTWSVLQRVGSIGYPAQNLVTTRLLSVMFDGMHPGPRQPLSANRLSLRGGAAMDTGNFVAFMTVGHTAFALLLGLCGGAIARRIYSRTVPVTIDTSKETPS